MNHRRATTRAVAAALGIGVVVAGSTPALAHHDQHPYYQKTWIKTSSSDADGMDAFATLLYEDSNGNFPEAARAEFRSHGEHFYIYDKHTDGHNVRGEIKVYGPEDPEVRKYTTGSSRHVNLDFPEGYSYQVRVCLDGAPTCTSWSPLGTT